MTRLVTYLARRADALEALLGLVLMAAGVAQWSIAAALVVAGGVLLILGVAGQLLAVFRRRP